MLHSIQAMVENGFTIVERIIINAFKINRSWVVFIAISYLFLQRPIL